MPPWLLSHKLIVFLYGIVARWNKYNYTLYKNIQASCSKRGLWVPFRQNHLVRYLNISYFAEQRDHMVFHTAIKRSEVPGKKIVMTSCDFHSTKELFLDNKHLKMQSPRNQSCLAQCSKGWLTIHIRTAHTYTHTQTYPTHTHICTSKTNTHKLQPTNTNNANIRLYTWHIRLHVGCHHILPVHPLILLL